MTGLKVSITRTAGLTLAVRLSSEVSATCTEAHDASSNDGVFHPFWRRFQIDRLAVVEVAVAHFAVEARHVSSVAITSFVPSL